MYSLAKSRKLLAKDKHEHATPARCREKFSIRVRIGFLPSQVVGVAYLCGSPRLCINSSLAPLVAPDQTAFERGTVSLLVNDCLESN